MDRQANPPIEQQFLIGKSISPIWQRWFQKLKTRDDEIRRRPDVTYTTDATLTTWELGKTVLFNIGSANTTCQLPVIDNRDLWAELTLIRFGTGRLTVTADAASVIEYSSLGGSIYCNESRRKAANVTLQIIGMNTWAIIAGLGIWDLD